MYMHMILRNNRCGSIMKQSEVKVGVWGCSLKVQYMNILVNVLLELHINMMIVIIDIWWSQLIKESLLSHGYRHTDKPVLFVFAVLILNYCFDLSQQYTVQLLAIRTRMCAMYIWLKFLINSIKLVIYVSWR